LRKSGISFVESVSCSGIGLWASRIVCERLKASLAHLLPSCWCTGSWSIVASNDSPS
jgi:hypothetical protein